MNNNYNEKGLTKEMVELKSTGMTYKEIGLILGVTRQRVQQIFKPSMKSLIEVSNRTKALCEICGQFDQFGHLHHKEYKYEILNNPDNLLYLCTSCHRELHSKKKKEKVCLHCGKSHTRNSKFCCGSCRKAYYSVMIKCSNCGKHFILGKKAQARLRRNTSGLFFCSKQCQGQYLGRHYGSKKEHHRDNGRSYISKYNEKLPEIIKRLQEGQKLSRALMEMNIPLGNIVTIKKLIARVN